MRSAWQAPHRNRNRQAAPPSVDLAPLEAQIEVAQQVGIEKDWGKARTYAAQSQAHLDKALAMLEDEVAEVTS